MGPRVTSQAVVGREAPLRELSHALEAAAEGRPALVLVAGEAGIGKTRLVRELEALADGFRILHGECVEFGGEALAYAPVVAALRDAPLEIEALPDEARGVLAAVLPLAAPRHGEPGQLFELLLNLLGRASEREPLLLVFEDVHWADPGTLALLAFLARNLQRERLLVVATYRVDDELPEPVRRLAAELARRVTRIELAPLTRDEVALQLEALAGGPVPAALADSVSERAGGNPFYVEELFAAREHVPATVTEAVLARVARLEVAPLAVIAAAGGHASHEVLERLEIAPDAVRAALDAGVLVRERDGVAFRHGLIGEVLYERLLPGERVALHRALADALGGAPAALRAHQYHLAGLRAEALEASLAAGLEAAGVYAYEAAHMHFERALELWAEPVDRASLLLHAAQAARFAGAPERAIALCEEAITLTDDPERLALLYARLGEFHFWDDEAALACYERALELVPGDPGLLAGKGHALMGLRRWEEARACCEAGLAAGAAPRITLGLVLAYLGEPAAGEAHLRRALEEATDGQDIARAHLLLGELLRLGGDRRAALAQMVEGEQAAARLGLSGSLGHFMFVNAADDLLALGRWDEAAERLVAAERMDLSRTAAALLGAAAGLLHVQRGELIGARAALDEDVGAGLPSEFLTPLGAARAELALLEGDAAAARAHVDGALAGVQDPFYTPPLFSLGLRVEAEARDPDAARADALLAAFESLLDGTATPPGAAAHLALARAEHARARGRPAADLWAAAGEAFARLEAPYSVAYARFREAETLLLGSGERPAAQRALTAARDAAAALGARPLLGEIDALARRARLDLGTPVPAPAVELAGGLTAREVDVLRLLADGLTNREIADRLFISQKTVAAHMAHIYDKLGVHSRVEAAGRAQRLGVLERPGST